MSRHFDDLDVVLKFNAEREKREGVMQSDLLSVERDECALIWSLKRSTQNLQLSTSCRPITPSLGQERRRADIFFEVSPSQANRQQIARP